MKLDPKKLQDCQNILAHLKTPDEIARRKNQDQDQDFLLVSFPRPFWTDAIDKIMQSKAYRCLGSKTHVLTDQPNIHIRSRQTHSSEVAHDASAICRILGLNHELALAIGLGHDLGHTPFGHLGEKFLTQVSGKPFRHEIMSVITAQQIERQGQGLFLTHQTLSGFLHHSLGQGDDFIDPSLLPEINAVRLADTIANNFGNYNDIFKRSRFNIEDFPELKELVQQCGANQRQRVNFIIYHICLESAERGVLAFSSSQACQLLKAIKSQMYQVYPKTNNPLANDILKETYDYLCRVLGDLDPCLILALMTDTDVLMIYQTIIQRGRHSDPDILKHCSVYELLPYLKNKPIDFTNPDLNW